MLLALNLSACNLLFVDRPKHLVATPDRRFHEALAFAQLQQNFRLLKFLLVLLESLIYVFAILGIDNEHIYVYLLR